MVAEEPKGLTRESGGVTSEGMQGDAKDVYNTSLPVNRGANNRVYLCRIRWDRRTPAFSRDAERHRHEKGAWRR